jgi:hypothetical protein
VVVLDVQAHALARATIGVARTLVVALAIVIVGLAACKLDDAMPPTPAVAATDAETRAAARLRAHVRAVPGVADARVVVSITPVDPFSRTPAPAPARVAFVVATRAGADAAVIGDAAQTAAHVALGADADVQVQLAPAPPVPRLVAVGPFRVAAESRNALVATLVVALLLVGGLAAALAVALARGYRRGIRPHQSSTSTTRGS